jgi:glucose-6-phosphate 1-dehydrogenase
LTGERSLYFYTAGTWGPSEADALLEKSGHRWGLGW